MSGARPPPGFNDSINSLCNELQEAKIRNNEPVARSGSHLLEMLHGTESSSSERSNLPKSNGPPPGLSSNPPPVLQPGLLGPRPPGFQKGSRPPGFPGPRPPRNAQRVQNGPRPPGFHSGPQNHGQHPPGPRPPAAQQPPSGPRSTAGHQPSPPSADHQPPRPPAAHQPPPAAPPGEASLLKERVDYSSACHLDISTTQSGPNGEMRVVWTMLSTQVLYSNIGRFELGIFRKSQLFHDNPIISRGVFVQDPKKKHISFRKDSFRTSGYINYRSPRSPGDYEMRMIWIQSKDTTVIAEGKDHIVIGKSVPFKVQVRGSDIAEAIRFIRKKLKAQETQVSAFLQLSRFIDQVASFVDNESESETKEAPGRLTLVWSTIKHACGLVVQVQAGKPPVVVSEDRELHSALHTLLIAIRRNVFLFRLLRHDETSLLALFECQFFCHLTQHYFGTPLEKETFWKENLGYLPWKCRPHEMKFQPNFEDIVHTHASALIPDEETFLNPRRQAREQLMHIVRDISTKRKCRMDLQVFGSSANHFGAIESDMDMCLVVLEDSEQISPVLHLEAMLSYLETKEYSNFILLESRLKARIPIIMLEDKHTHLQIDICVNNPLALRNTNLMRAYSICDDRVRPLAYLIKKWTKVRCMNSPSDGTLSSYGYIIMLISYLQKTNPPVLPILTSLHPNWNGDPQMLPREARRQEMNLPSVPCPDKLMKKLHETYFYDPTSNPSQIQHCGRRNTSSVLQLLVGFLHYYAVELDTNAQLVSIRTSVGAPCGVDGAEKVRVCPEWKPTRRLSIEDPFEIGYDVAHVLKDSRYAYIRSEFGRAYALIEEACRGAKNEDEFRTCLDEMCAETENPFKKKEEENEDTPLE